MTQEETFNVDAIDTDPNNLNVKGPEPPVEGGTRNAILVLVLIFILALGALGGGYYFFISQVSDNEKTIRISGSELASRTISYLDKSFSGDISFTNATYECNAAGCTFEDAGNPFGGSQDAPLYGYVIQAYDDYANATGDDVYQQRADSIMAIALAACQETASVCVSHFTPLASYYERTKNPIYLTAMERAGGVLLDETKTYRDLFNVEAGRKLEVLYDVTGESAYRELLVDLAQQSLGGANEQEHDIIYTTEEGFAVRQGDVQIVWTFYLPAYRVTGDDVYLEAAESFFDQGEVREHVSSESPLFPLSTSVKAIAALFDLSEVVERSKQAGYYRFAVAVLEDLVDSRMDNPENPKFNSDGGTLERFNAPVNTKDSLFNGLLASQFLRVSRDQISIEIVVEEE